MNSDPSFELIACSLAMMQGHPTVSFYHAADDVVVNICPTPVLGLTDEPYTVFYQGQVLGPKDKVQNQQQCQVYVDTAVPKIGVVFVHEACGLAADQPVPMFISGSEPVALSEQTSVYDFVMHVAIKPENYLLLVQQLSLQAEAVHTMLEKFGTAKQTDVH